MAKAQPKLKDYRSLRRELDEVVAKLQGDDIDIEDAIKLHARGQELIKQLEDYIKQAENSIKKIKTKFN